MSPTQTDVIPGSDTPAWPRSTSPQKETELRRSWSARSGKRSAEQPNPAAGLDHPSGEDSAPIRVLVVDDEPDVQRLFQMRFRKDIRAGEFELHFARPSTGTAGERSTS
jgi:hypothetical protein